MRNPRSLAEEMERDPVLPKGSKERFSGYGVLGLPFRSGHILAFRRMVSSSVGPGYASVWHRDPTGYWTFFTDVNPVLSCPRFFGALLDKVVVGEIEVRWEGPFSLSLRVPSSGFQWGIRLSSDFRTRVMSTVGRMAPSWMWRNGRIGSALGTAGGRFLNLGHLSLAGAVPNAQTFYSAPNQLWRVEASAAILNYDDLGPIGPLAQQAKLGDFWIPNSGLLAFGEARFSPLDPEEHSSLVTRDQNGSPLPGTDGIRGLPGRLRPAG